MNYDQDLCDQQLDDFMMLDDWMVVNDPVAYPRVSRSTSSCHTSDSIDQYIYDTLGEENELYQAFAVDNNQIDTDGTTPSLEDSSSVLGSTESSGREFTAAGDDHQQLTEKAIQEVINNPTNPVGKFLRDSHISADLAAHSGIMEYLIKAPRKPRSKYGKRRFRSEQEREEINRERNRTHAQATRKRKKMFKTVLALRDKRPSWSTTAPPRGNGSTLPRSSSRQAPSFDPEDEVDYSPFTVAPRR